MVNLSSKTTWYCGLTKPDERFRTKATDLAWHGEWPKYIPVCDLGCHFGVPMPPD